MTTRIKTIQAVQLTATCKRAGIPYSFHSLTPLNKFISSPEITRVPELGETSMNVTHSLHIMIHNYHNIKIRPTCIYTIKTPLCSKIHKQIIQILNHSKSSRCNHSINMYSKKLMVTNSIRGISRATNRIGIQVLKLELEAIFGNAYQLDCKSENYKTTTKMTKKTLSYSKKY